MIKKILLDELRSISFKILVLIIIIATSLRLIIPSIISKIINYTNEGKDMIEIINISLISIVVLSLIVICNFLSEKVRLKIVKKLKINLLKKVYNRIYLKNNTFFSNKNMTELTNSIEQDVESITSLFSSNLISSIVYILLCIGSIIILFRLNILLTICVITLSLTKFFLVSKFSRDVQNNQINILKLSENWYKFFGSIFNHIMDIRSFKVKKSVEDYYSKLLNQKVTLENKQSLILELLGYINSYIDELTTISIYIIGAYLISIKSINIGTLISVTIYASYVSNPIDVISNIYIQLKSIQPSYSRLEHVLLDDTLKVGQKSISNIETIEFEDVSYSSSEKEILSNITFKIESKEKVALIGGNGSGKTTILLLILGIIKPSSGSIKINNINIEELDMDTYWSNISFIKQNSPMSNYSIVDNIYFFRKRNKKQLDDLISDLKLENIISKKGFDYAVGENGEKLSGGEKQKIILAKYNLLLKDLLIMDEPTSNIEKDYMNIYQNLIFNKNENNTVILVTHDYDLLENFKKIILIQKSNAYCFENYNDLKRFKY
ncbi:ATP-binding cassette domain-containing protein [Vagococcus fluvialis]|uniref:Putrescine transport ATP-binding protein PotA (TC 3.A.1.11.1) n=1 Tax=Vagococcus fluvialis bH819 TaxID=1255619 RepID=A0A1X6WRR3_9ENTE|nr:ABC transporter ATP-binding protein [Vagococcus fluvialis]SLM86980.1 Putrescine transport ATP-binding protein PotA (TC 3.A.1.11.1) [Vagococcus fluvialis bH819]